MATPYTETLKGRAMFAGCALALDVILYATEATQSADFTQNFNSFKVQNSRGFDVAERATNALTDATINMMLIGDTAANAKALNTVSVGGFLPPLQTVTISDPSSGPTLPALMKGKFKVKSGKKISVKNAACGDMSLPIEQYQDSDQNDLMTSVPA